MNVLAVLSPTADVVLAAVHEYERRSEDYPTSRDIAKGYGWPITDVSDKLSQLATRGRVERLPGGVYRTKGALTIVPPMQAADRKEPEVAPPAAATQDRAEDVKRYYAVEWPPAEEFMRIVEAEYAKTKPGAIHRLTIIFQCTDGAIQRHINTVYRERGLERPTRSGTAAVRNNFCRRKPRVCTDYGLDADFAAVAEQAFEEHADPLQVLMDRYGAPSRRAVEKHVISAFARLNLPRPYMRR